MVEPRFRWTFPDAVTPSPDGRRRGAGPRHLDPDGGHPGRPAGPYRPTRPRGLVRGSARRPARSGAAARCRPDSWPRLTSARDRGERVLVFGDFDADGLTGLAIMTLALRRFGVAVEPVRAEPARRGPRPVAGGARCGRGAAGATVIVTVDCGSTSVAEIAAANARGIDVIVTDHHRVPAVLPAGARHRQPASARLDLPGPPPGGERRGLQDRPAAARGRARRSGWPPSTSRTSRRSDRSPTWRPIVGENRAIARLGLERLRSRAAARDRGAPRAGRGSRPAAIDLETVVVRHRAAAQRRRPGGGGARGGPPPARRRTRPRRGVHADALEAANLTRRDLMKSAVAEARAVVAEIGRRRPRPSCAVRGRVGIVGLVAARLAEDRGRPGGRRGRARRRRPRLVPERRRARPGRGPRALRATCFIRYGGHAGAAGFELAGRPLGRVPRALPGHRRARPRRPTRGRPSPSTWRCRAIDVDYALHRELAGLAPCGPGNPEPLVAVLGLTVTRVRAATGGHSQLDPATRPRRARRHRVRPAGHRRGRPRGRPARRRRPARRAGASAASSRSSSRSATSRPPGSHPEARGHPRRSRSRRRPLVGGVPRDPAVDAPPRLARRAIRTRSARPAAGSAPVLSIVGLLARRRS